MREALVVLAPLRNLNRLQNLSPPFLWQSPVVPIHHSKAFRSRPVLLLFLRSSLRSHRSPSHPPPLESSSSHLLLPAIELLPPDSPSLPSLLFSSLFFPSFPSSVSQLSLPPFPPPQRLQLLILARRCPRQRMDLFDFSSSFALHLTA